MVKTSTAGLLTRHTHCLPHSMNPVTLPVAGVDFHAVSAMSPVSPRNESINRCAVISCSLAYDDLTCIWSNAVQVSLEGSSLLEIEKGDRMLIPVYNPRTRSNESFIPMRVSLQREKGIGVIVFTPSILLKNQLDRVLWVQIGDSEQKIDPNTTSPLHVSGILTQTEWTIVVKCSEEEEWSQSIPVKASQTRITLIHSVFHHTSFHS